MKNYKDKLKSEKGSITSVVLVTILFFITILSTAYVVTATLRKSQLKSEIAIKETYESEFNNIDEIYTSLQIKNGEGVKIPDGFYYVGGTVDTGLVISDNSADENKYYGQTTVGRELQGNQYVWVEVPKTVEVYQTAGTTLDLDALTGTELETAYKNIEDDLYDYTSTYRNGTSSSDTYYEDTDNEGWFAEATAYNDAKKAMLKSVYKNGGFYIGRYETGIAYTENPRTASGATTQTPVIKANAYPYNWVTRTQAQVLANSMYSGNRTSSLMFGVQWDLVLKYLETKAVEKGAALATIQEELNGTTTGSTSWGNYADAEIEITNTNAKYAIYNTSSGLGSWNPIPASYTKPTSGTENKVILSTGANEERNSKQNICDLAGNVWEWTLENTSDADSPCSIRGGIGVNTGYHYPASYRIYNNTTLSVGTISFRVSIY